MCLGGLAAEARSPARQASPQRRPAGERLGRHASRHLPSVPGGPASAAAVQCGQPPRCLRHADPRSLPDPAGHGQAILPRPARAWMYRCPGSGFPRGSPAPGPSLDPCSKLPAVPSRQGARRLAHHVRHASRTRRWRAAHAGARLAAHPLGAGRWRGMDSPSRAAGWAAGNAHVTPATMQGVSMRTKRRTRSASAAFRRSRREAARNTAQAVCQQSPARSLPGLAAPSGTLRARSGGQPLPSPRRLKG